MKHLNDAAIWQRLDVDQRDKLAVLEGLRRAVEASPVGYPLAWAPRRNATKLPSKASGSSDCS